MAGGTKRQQAIAKALAALAPRIPLADAIEVRRMALGSPGLKRLRSPDRAVWLALVAYVRHRYTDYDDLFDEGYDRDAARHFVVGPIEEKLLDFGVTCGLDADLADDPDDVDAVAPASAEAGGAADPDDADDDTATAQARAPQALDRPVTVQKVKRRIGDHDPDDA